jgi:hypothetical protein
MRRCEPITATVPRLVVDLGREEVTFGGETFTAPPRILFALAALAHYAGKEVCLDELICEMIRLGYDQTSASGGDRANLAQDLCEDFRANSRSQPALGAGKTNVLLNLDSTQVMVIPLQASAPSAPFTHSEEGAVTAAFASIL